MLTRQDVNASDLTDRPAVGPGPGPGPGPRSRRKRPAPTRWRPSLQPVEPRVLLSLTIAFDYSLDAANFFDTQAKRDLMQQAGSAIASQINDSLAAIVPGGFNTWTARFPNPSTGATQSIPNLVVPANTMILYVGGGHLAGRAEAGEGSTGGYDASGDPATWLPTVASRGQAGVLASPPTDFGPWGGSITFDNSGSTNWFFGATLNGIGSGQTDFLSVAQHEIGHVLGIGTSDSWFAKVANGKFTGTNAAAANGGTTVPVTAAGDHWAQSVKSDGANALMDPILVNGSRVSFTSLDLAALRDIGWQVQALARPSAQFAAATYSIVEQNGGLAVTITRTGGPGAFTVNYATADGTAKAGLDYLATAGTLTFAAGDTSKTVTLTILNDALAEGTETFNLTLSAPSAGAVLGTPATTVVSISDPTNYRAGFDFGPDGRSDLGLFRPSTATWSILNGAAGTITPPPSFGATNLFDIPIVGDFDGVGRAELAVFRPSTAQWFVLGPNGGHLLGTFGATNLFDIPVPGDYDGDGRTEMAVFRPSTAQWFAMGPNGGYLVGTFGATNLFDIPAPADYDGLGRTQPAVFRPSSSQWFAKGPTGGHLLGTYGQPNLAELPIETSTASLLKLGKLGGGPRAAAIPTVRTAAAVVGNPFVANTSVSTPGAVSPASPRSVLGLYHPPTRRGWLTPPPTRRARIGSAGLTASALTSGT